MWGVLKLSNQLPELETQKWTTGGFRVLAPPAGGIGQWVRSNRKVELLNGRDGSAPASITRTQLVPFSNSCLFIHPDTTQYCSHHA